MTSIPYSKRLVAAFIVLLATCAGAAGLATIATAGETALPATNGTAAGQETTWSDVLADDTGNLDWLKSFEDAELETLVAEALRHNREPTLAGANLQTAEQLAAQAGKALSAAIADGDTTAAAEYGSSFGAARNLQWEVDIWNRLGAIAADREASQASSSELEAAGLSLVAQTAKAWFLATEANLQLDLSQQAIDIRQQALQIARGRADAGDAAGAEVSPAAAQLDAARERQRLAIGALVQALRSIKVILGRYPSAELLELREIVPEPPPLPAGIPAALLERRPDLVAAQRRVAAAFAHRQDSIVALPRLPLTSGSGDVSDELIRLLDAGSRFFSRGENFLVAVDNGNAQGAVAGIGSGERQTVLKHYAAIARQALADVVNHLDNDARLRQRAAALTASADAIAGKLAAANHGGDAHDADPAQLLRLEANALATRIRLVRIQYARLAQRVDLYLALGGGFGR